MTKIYIEKNKNKYIVTANGHATGSDKVCAAVSALVYSLHGYLMNSDGDVYASINEIYPNGAKAEFEWFGDSAAKAIFELILVGFMSLKLSEGKYISVNFVDNT